MKTVDFKKKAILLHVFLSTLLVCILMSSWTIQAAGLGNLNVGSYLGQPFKAEIALMSVKEEEIASLSARLASPEDFQKAGISYASFLSTLSVSIEKRTDGQPYLQITSTEAINEPFLNLLIELNWSSGRVLREYTVLLDPVETQKTTSATPILQPSADRDSADDKPTASSQKPLAMQPERADWIGEIYGPVSQGDTLSRIARQVTPEGVDLNQMLVALYRANRDAFIEKNMNLLRVGVILRIPDQAEISSIAPREAVREVRLQTENWNTYRRRVADVAAGSVADTDPRQSLTGKITSVAEKPVTPGMSRAEEVLILSKGELLSGDQPAIKDAEGEAAQNYLRMMEEDAIAKERALEEANERVAMLEQNIAKLQRLLELRNSASEVQTQTQIEQSQPQPETVDSQSALSQSARAGTTPMAAVPTAESDKDSALPEFTIPAQSVVAESLVNPVLQAEQQEANELLLLDTFVDFAMENVELLGGALAALLVIWLSASIIRRRSEKADDFDEVDAYSYAEKGTVASMADSDLAPDTKSSSHERADLDSPTETPSDDLKFQHSNTSEDPAVAASGFFFGKKLEESFSKDLESEENSTIDVSDTESSDVSEKTIVPDHEIKFDIESDGPDLTETAEQTSSEIQQSDEDIKWDFSDLETDLNIERKGAVDDSRAISEDEVESQDTNQIAFESDFSEPLIDSGESFSTDEMSKLESSLADIDLDLGEPSKEPSVSEDAEEDNTRWQEVATKIDLAKAYLEMDDLEGAKEILEEVLREGDSEQQTTARSMLDKMS